MATSAIEAAPQPGDGKFLMNVRQSGRGRRRHRKSTKLPANSLPLDVSGPAQVEAGMNHQGKSERTPARTSHHWKEPTSLHPAPGNALGSVPATPQTITSRRPLSRPTRGRKKSHHVEPAPPAAAHTRDNTKTKTDSNNHALQSSSTRKSRRAMAQGNSLLPPHLRGKSIPPHLRPKQSQPPAKTTPAPTAATNPPPQSPANSGPVQADSRRVTSPAVASPSSSAAGLAGSKHAPPGVRYTSPPTTTDQSVTQKLMSVGAAVSEPKPAATAANESVAQKLASVGATVSGAKPVGRPSLVAYASSEEGGEPSKEPSQALPKDPVTHSKQPQKKTTNGTTSNLHYETRIRDATATSAVGDDQPPKRSHKAPSPRQSQKGTQPQRGHVSQRGGRGRGGRAPKESKWPKNSEIPKGDPERWEIKWEEDKDDSCSVDSLRADSGWGGGTKKPKVPPGIDPDTGFLLTDYSGNWGPAPVDWDARPAFRPQQSAETIEKWKQRIEEEMLGKTWAIPHDDVEAADGTIYYFAPSPDDKTLLIQGDFAPRYWSPVVVGRESPSTFWRKLVASNEPEPFDKGDLVGVKPWWETYASAHGFSLQPYDHPICKGIRPTETEHERLSRENDNGSLTHTENRKRAEIAKRDAQRERRKKAMEKARKLSAGRPLGPSRQIKTGLNLYLRSACPEDMPRIKEIYNHYVEHTVCVPETERRKDADMLARYNDIVSKKLPFLVACERGGQIKSRKNKHEPIILPEKLVGFAYADDHHDMKGMYRFTCDVEVYTDSTQYMKGVAKCLLDKLLGLLDPDYAERGGYAIEGAELEGDGVSRVISNIIITVPYEKEERLEWKGRFLREFLGFDQVGNMRDTGNKLGQSVSVATFQRGTGATFDPANPPIMSEYTR